MIKPEIKTEIYAGQFDRLVRPSDEMNRALAKYNGLHGYLKPAPRSHDKMTEVLMDSNAIGPNIHYWMVRGNIVDKKPNDGQVWSENNITIWEQGKVGNEFIKTYGHIHVGNLAETYKFLEGKGIALLQKHAVHPNGSMINDIVEEFKAISVRKGQELYIPAGVGHLVVNTGEGVLVTQDDSPVHLSDSDPSAWPGHADYELVRKMRGFAYYVVEHNGKPALAINYRYKEVRSNDFGGIPVLPIPQE